MKFGLSFLSSYWWVWLLLILTSTPWPSWFLAIADALLHPAMSRPLEMSLWRPSPWQPLCLWHQYHHPTANGRGRERTRALTLWNPVVQFRRRCNLGDYACQDENDDFWFNKHVKHSRTLLLVALRLISVFIIRAWQKCFIAAVAFWPFTCCIHKFLRTPNWNEDRPFCLSYSIRYNGCCVFGGGQAMTVVLCKVKFAEVVKWLWWDLLVSF